MDGEEEEEEEEDDDDEVSEAVRAETTLPRAEGDHPCKHSLIGTFAAGFNLKLMIHRCDTYFESSDSVVCVVCVVCEK